MSLPGISNRAIEETSMRLQMQTKDILSLCSPFTALPSTPFTIKSKLSQHTYLATRGHTNYLIKFLLTQDGLQQEVNFLVEVVLLALAMQTQTACPLSPKFYHLAPAPFCLKVKDTSRKTMMVLEYFESGSLERVFSDPSSRRSILQKGWRFILQVFGAVASAIQFLHSNHFIHG